MPPHVGIVGDAAQLRVLVPDRARPIADAEKIEGPALDPSSGLVGRTGFEPVTNGLEVADRES